MNGERLWVIAAAPVRAPEETTWGWEQNLAVGSAVVSVLALILAWVSYRQRVRYHPQPKLVFEWSERIRPTEGFLVRDLTLTNYGDAVARDLSLTTEFAATSPWKKTDAV